MATFDELVEQIDKNVEGQRNRGTAFEKMAASYLKNEPSYKKIYRNVWMLSDVPAEYHISKKDTGVDLVAEDYFGNLTAVQAKFYQGKIGKDTINSFVAETGKSYYTNGLLISTTDEWNKNAEAAIEGTTKPITRIGLSQLRHAHFNWQKFSFSQDNDLSDHKVKRLRDYQKKAIDKSVKYFKEHDRGKLIMAPGTGKTFTSLKIAEALKLDQHKQEFNVLYLVPSIQLLSQTLFSWNDDVSENIKMTSFSVVSDRKATKRKKADDDDLAAKDIGFPATTNVDELMSEYRQIKELHIGNQMTVIFSTYQSIDVITKAQKAGYPEFDLIIADEAHRTTGAKDLGQDGDFTKVHSNNNVKGKLRLYQTATPKIYDAKAKKKAEENSIVVSSMDDEAKYGQEIFRLGFGDAVSRGYLTDYKVMVLAVSESFVNKDMQHLMAADNQLKVDDIGKIIGVWNAMVKRNGITGEITGAPMKRAIAFTDTIKHSKIIADEFKTVVNEYLNEQAEDSFSVDVRHADGSFNALQKGEAVDWLEDENIEDNHARVLSNVRFLTEGIDVPNLDAIIFFSPKKSQVDIVQAVGRIMRRYEGKDYGYIILPIVVADGADPSAALDNDTKYKGVWQVLNALRSTDERFEAEVNNLNLKKKKSGKIDFIGTDTSPDHPITENEGKQVDEARGSEQIELPLNWKEMRQAFYGKVVKHVGDRRYLEDWSKDVTDIAKQYIRRINDLIDSNSNVKHAFAKFLKSLRYNINGSINHNKAVEMLAQHLITEPVFDALFGEYSFVKSNVVSKAINSVIDEFKKYGFAKEQESLKPFYDSIKLRASGIDNVAGKQELIRTLYDKFFRTGFKDTTDQLGVVFTPIQIVDFIIHSVDYALNKYFNKSIADKNVHILDPFVGTGTFITRTLQYLKEQLDAGKITYDDILRKYMHELHANEIVLLSYYIAAINIEAVFEEISNSEQYQPFDGIVLTDTFESTEQNDSFEDELFGQNNNRLKEEQAYPITAIIANPPYSVGQKNANDNNQNLHYVKLEKRLKETYVDGVHVKNKNSLYDSYFKAFRWASDRIGDKGVIGFVTNGSYIDSNSATGFRASLYEEFNHLYIFNLRGNARTSGEKRRKEKDNVFGQGTRTPIAISILVKDGTDKHEIFYHDIGDYLSRNEKFKIISKFDSICNVNWVKLLPDKYNDWINTREDNFESYLPFISKNNIALFNDNTTGITTGRDAWVTGFSRNNMKNNVLSLIKNYNSERKRIDVNVENLKGIVNNDPKFIKWDDSLLKELSKNKIIRFNDECIKLYMYRPFTKKWIYFDSNVIQRVRKFRKIDISESSPILYSTGTGAKYFSVIVSNIMVDKGLMSSGQGYYTKKLEDSKIGLEDDLLDNFDNDACSQLGLSKENTLFYIYSVLNSNEYKKKFINNLTKECPHIPVVKNKEKYVEIGKKLVDLHLNYESVSAYEDVESTATEQSNYQVSKMRFGKKKDENGKNVKDLSTIIFNDDITINNIPDKAYEYVVNGRSAIEWIMDQYQINIDEHSGITDDPNDYSDDPKYIYNLLLSIINVSVKTVDLVNELPKFEVVEYRKN